MTVLLSTLSLSLVLAQVGLDPQRPLAAFVAKAAQGFTCVRGAAGWYGQQFQGRHTASGEVFDMHALTAAHRTLPFGTLVQVRHLRNGRSVVVRINDRGPFVRGRELDLSLAAARELGFERQGLCKVEFLVLGREERQAVSAGRSGRRQGWPVPPESPGNGAR